MTLKISLSNKLAWAIAFSVTLTAGWSCRNRSDAPRNEPTDQVSGVTYVPRPAKLLQAEAGQLGHDTNVAREVADKAVEGVWSMPLGRGKRPWRDVKNDLISLWKADQIKSNTWQFRVHSLFVLYDLMIADKGMARPEYIQLGKEIIDSWAANNPHRDPPCDYSWNDHAAANRTIGICTFADYCDWLGMLDEEFKQRLGGYLAVHAEFLAEPENYTHTHNHGIFQDYALTLAATHLTPSPQSRKWLRLATDRLDEQLRVTFSENGIHLEHSPSYHMWITGLIERIARYMAATNCEAGDQLARKLPLAKAARQSFIMPGGAVPPVGDTPRNYKLGKPPKTSGLLVHPEAGYGIIRGSLTVFIQAGHKSFAHKHSDDLSLLVFTRSGPVITDTGFLNYEPDNPKRHYTTSWRAHSTVTWKSEPLQQRSVLSGIEAYGSAGPYSFIRASSTRPDGQRHIRCVFHDDDQQIVAIADSCTSPVKVDWQRRFIIDPSVAANLVEGGRATLDAGRDGKLDVFLWPDKCDRRIVTGQADPLEGWVANAWGDLVPAPVLLEEIEAEQVTLAAMIRPAGKDDASISVDADGRMIIEVGSSRMTVAASATDVRVERDGRVVTITLKPNRLTKPM